MAIPVLLVTPSSGFGELIRQTLEDEGNYRVHAFSQGADAQAAAQKTDYALAILDAATPDVSILELGENLQSRSPDIHLIVVPNEDYGAETLAPLEPHGYLTKPFYLPHLLHIVESVLRGGRVPLPEAESLPETGLEIPDDLPEVAPPPERETPAPADTSAVPPARPWLQNPDRAEQHLARVSRTSTAKAALLMRDEAVWARAGALPSSHAQALADTIHEYWQRYEGNDLARLIRLEETGEQYMLYATPIEDPLFLALAFNADTPFGAIRRQAAGLAQALKREPGQEAAEDDRLPDAVPQPGPESAPASSDPAQTVIESRPEPGEAIPPADSYPQAESAPDLPSNGEPIPIPDDWLPKARPRRVQEAETEPIPIDWRPDQAPSQGRRAYLANMLAGDDDPPPAAQKERVQPFVIAEVEEEIDPGPALPESAPPLVLEPVSPSLYNLTYACVLIPRFPAHKLTGDLGNHLDAWVPDLSVAFGWRVDHMLVREGYMQWIANVPPSTSPDRLVSVIRRITSQRVFIHYPKLKEVNPADDFWAPGYLILSSGELPSPELINRFIQKTRKRQGLI